MARKKVALQWIANDSTRRATFKKRRKGLMKKASELATLCGVDVFVAVYVEGEAQPEVWPDAPGEAERIAARFKAVPDLDQCKKKLDMEGLLRQQNDKSRDQLHKAQLENRERERQLLLHDAIAGRRPGLVGLSVEQVVTLGLMVEQRIQAVMDAIARLQGEGHDLPAATAPPQPPLALRSTEAGAGHRDMMMPQAPHPQGWMMAVGDTRAPAYSGFIGAGGTSAGGDMPLQFSGMGFGFAGPDAGQSFPSM
ncbi:agamous-like MADS-box protein AGL80 [Panicum miliaceum]|uniref:Agamous-like MADS-box protein AGL80 n=1 Tax=Panicum miliaceum TaxID=4540 RepID=A0A3L6QBL9_PANMI|nr:agamous-like MADS-box protein AGL80 [Panicum miliaceum]